MTPHAPHPSTLDNKGTMYILCKPTSHSGCKLFPRTEYTLCTLGLGQIIPWNIRK